MVSNLVKVELAYINTSHPDFIGGSRAVARLMDRIGKEGQQQRERRRKGGTTSANVSIPESGGDGDGEAQSISGSRHGGGGGGGGVGATPLSSSSLENYVGGSRAMNGEDDLTSQVRDGDGRVGDEGSVSGGGIMNLIFRGGGGGRTSPYPGSRTPLRGGGGGAAGAGPPAVVQLPSVPPTMRQTDVGPPTDRERVEVEIIKSLIDSYFSIVRKNFVDMVPKTIMYFLVNHVRDAMQNELVSELYRDAEVGTLMREADDVAQRRRTCAEMRELLGRALEIVNEVRDFNTFK